MKKKLVALWWTVDLFFERHRTLVFLLAFAVLLRIPSYFEPYWYGDEAIYLTIGHALNQGKILYKDIVDHKTPMIYLFATVGSQLGFRLLLTLWLLPAFASFFYLTKQFFLSTKIASMLTALCIIGLSIPTFEGLIPNGELFVLGFFLPGLALLYHTLIHTPAYAYPSIRRKSLLNAKQLYLLVRHTVTITTKIKLLVVGILFGFAILTKVPAVFDVFSAYLLVFLLQFSKKSAKTNWLAGTIQALAQYFWLTLGVILPILISIMFFLFLGSIQDYLQFGLLYNLHYSGTWIPTSSLFLSSAFYSLPFKLGLLVVATVSFLTLVKKLPPQFLFTISWAWWALIASTLSNRPYPHYFLQVIPALVLLVGFLVLQLYSFMKSQKKSVQKYALYFLTSCTTLAMVAYANGALGIWENRYSSGNYYSKFFQVATGKMSTQAYQQSFNWLIEDNAVATSFITATQPSEIAIWGNNPLLYAQTKTSSADRYTVLFHVEDLNQLEQSQNRIITKSPEYVILMKNVDPPEKLLRFVNNNYIPKLDLDSMTVWQKRSLEELASLVQ